MSKHKIYETEDIVGASFIAGLLGLLVAVLSCMFFNEVGVLWYVTAWITLALIELTMLIFKPRFIHSDSKMADAFYSKSVLLCIYGFAGLIVALFIKYWKTILEIVGWTLTGCLCIAALIGFIYLNSLLYKDKEKKNGNRR